MEECVLFVTVVEYKLLSPLQTDRHLVVDTTEGVLQLFPETYKKTGCTYWIGVSGSGGWGWD